MAKITLKKRNKLNMTATTAYNADQKPEHHFFASSVATWRVSYDLHQLIEDMAREGYCFNVALVPGPIDTPYQIRNFMPQLEGTTYLAFYDNAGE